MGTGLSPVPEKGPQLCTAAVSFRYIMDIMDIVFVIWGRAKENPQIFQLCCYVFVKKLTAQGHTGV